MKIFGWNVGWSRNIAIGVIWTSPVRESKEGFRSVGFLFLGLTIWKDYPLAKADA